MYIWDSLSRLEFLRRWILQTTNYNSTMSILSVVRGIKLAVGSYYEEILQERDNKIDTPENEKDKRKQAKRKAGKKKSKKEEGEQ